MPVLTVSTCAPQPVAPARSGRGRPPLHALTGLRFFAAFAVVLFHYADDVARSPLWLGNLLSSGFLAVNLFFILSGFILAYNYLDLAGRIEIARGDFYRARFARIYPIYLVGLLLFAPFLIVEYLRQYPLQRMAAKLALVVPSTIALVQAWIPPAALEWNAPSWSLSVEAFFYALFPLLAPAVYRAAGRRPRMLLGALWAAMLLAPLAFVLLDPHPAVWPWSGVQDACPWSIALSSWPLLRLPEFLAGVVLCRLYLDGRLRTPGWLLATGGAVALVAVLAVRWRLSLALVSGGLLDPLLCLIVLGLALDRGPLARWMSLPALVLLGEASYSLYILHVPAWAWFCSVNERFFGYATTTLGFLLVYCAFVMALSVFMLRAIELPYRRAIRAGGSPKLRAPLPA